MSISDKIAKNVDYSQNFRKMSIGVNFHENLVFWSKLSENLDLGQHFRKISILVNIFGKIDLGKKNPQILVLVKISEKCQFDQNLQICRFWSKISKNLDFGQKFRK